MSILILIIGIIATFKKSIKFLDIINLLSLMGMMIEMM